MQLNRILNRVLRVVCVVAALNIPLAATAAPLDLSNLRGRVVYLDFWASWCAPCRQSFPWMDSMSAAYTQQGLTVVAVNVDHDRADADRFLQTFKPRFEVRFDPDGAWAQQFNVVGMPTSIIIDRSGKARFVHTGFTAADSSLSARQIQELLDER